MHTTISLDLNDIQTFLLGKNIAVKVNENLMLTFTPEAAKELAEDISEILELGLGRDLE